MIPIMEAQEVVDVAAGVVNAQLGVAMWIQGLTFAANLYSCSWGASVKEKRN